MLITCGRLQRLTVNGRLFPVSVTQLLKNLEPYIAQGMSKVGQLKEEQQQSKEGLEAMIFSHR